MRVRSWPPCWDPKSNKHRLQHRFKIVSLFQFIYVSILFRFCGVLVRFGGPSWSHVGNQVEEKWRLTSKALFLRNFIFLAKINDFLCRSCEKSGGFCVKPVENQVISVSNPRTKRLVSVSNLRKIWWWHMCQTCEKSCEFCVKAATDHVMSVSNLRKIMYFCVKPANNQVMSVSNQRKIG